MTDGGKLKSIYIIKNTLYFPKAIYKVLHEMNYITASLTKHQDKTWSIKSSKNFESENYSQNTLQLENAMYRVLHK